MQVLISDIEHHQVEVSRLLTHHELLRAKFGQLTKTEGTVLAQEIADLYDLATRRRKDLARLLDEQVVVEEQMVARSADTEESEMRRESAPTLAHEVCVPSAVRVVCSDKLLSHKHFYHYNSQTVR